MPSTIKRKTPTALQECLNLYKSSSSPVNRVSRLNRMGEIYEKEILIILEKENISILKENNSPIKYERKDIIEPIKIKKLEKIKKELEKLIEINSLSEITGNKNEEEIKIVDGVIPPKIFRKEEGTDTKYVVLSKGTQGYKLSGRSYEAITNFPNQGIYKRRRTNCGENTETWIALNIKRATDYIDPDLDWASAKMLGMVTKEPLNLVVCSGKLKSVCHEMKQKLIEKLGNSNQDVLGNQSERLYIASLLFGFTKDTTNEQMATAIVNLYRHLFGIPVSRGGNLCDIPNERTVQECTASLLNNDINMNMDNQHKMLKFLHYRINKILENEDEAIRLHNIKKVTNAKKMIENNLKSELTGGLTAIEYTDIYLKKAESLNLSSNTTLKKKTKQRVSYTALDRIVAYALCLITPIDKTPTYFNRRYTPTNQIRRKYHGWYLPNVESTWADGETITLNGKKKQREKELEEIMIFNEKALTEKKFPKLQKIYAVVDHMIKSKNYSTCYHCKNSWSGEVEKRLVKNRNTHTKFEHPEEVSETPENHKSRRLVKVNSKSSQTNSNNERFTGFDGLSAETQTSLAPSLMTNHRLLASNTTTAGILNKKKKKTHRKKKKAKAKKSTKKK